MSWNRLIVGLLAPGARADAFSRKLFSDAPFDEMDLSKRGAGGSTHFNPCAVFALKGVYSVLRRGVDTQNAVPAAEWFFFWNLKQSAQRRRTGIGRFRLTGKIAIQDRAHFEA